MPAIISLRRQFVPGAEISCLHLKLFHLGFGVLVFLVKSKLIDAPQDPTGFSDFRILQLGLLTDYMLATPWASELCRKATYRRGRAGVCSVSES
jgi:hypothetical protein